MPELNQLDLAWCVRLLPIALRQQLKAQRGHLMVAGGYIRACVAGEKVSDIDIVAPSSQFARDAAYALAFACGNAKVYSSPNAHTVKIKPVPVQYVHRWVFDSPRAAIESFDFTIARAAIWWNGARWESIIADTFYQDLAAKRLIYCAPVRIEEVGGSLLRVLKFYQRGYRIPLDSLAGVVARLACGNVQATEFETAKAFTKLLVEVDPSVDPEHMAHLPSATTEADNA